MGLCNWCHFSGLTQYQIFLCKIICCAPEKTTGWCLTVHLEAARGFGFPDAVLRDAGVSALVLAAHLGQAQAVVAADLKPGTATEWECVNSSGG